MKLGNILKSCGLLLLCSALCADFSVATSGSLGDEGDTQAQSIHLTTLPREMLLRLDEVRDVLSFGKSCKTLHSIGETDAIWKKLHKNLKLPLMKTDPVLSHKEAVLKHYKHCLTQDLCAAISEDSVGRVRRILDTSLIPLPKSPSKNFLNK